MLTNDFKCCKECGETKPISDFQAINKGTNRRGTCSQCRTAQRRQNEAADADHSAKNYERTMRWRSENREKYLADKKAESERHRAKRQRKTVEQMRADITAAEVARHEAKAEEKAEREQKRAVKRAKLVEQKPWLAANLTKAERYRTRYRLDPVFHVKQRLRLNARKKRRCGAFGDLLRMSLKANSRSRSVERTIGYSIVELKDHLESRFTNGMTWDVFMKGAIHIDHIKPLALFNMQDETDFRQAWSLSNLQPLWAADNLRKGATWDGFDPSLIDGDWRGATLDMATADPL